MNRYYVYNKTRKTWCLVSSKEFLVEGQVILAHFDNEDIDELCECVVIKVMRGLES